jgi:hypothetical protein
VTAPGGDELRDLQTFVVQLGAAMNAAGEPVEPEPVDTQLRGAVDVRLLIPRRIVP